MRLLAGAPDAAARRTCCVPFGPFLGTGPPELHGGAHEGSDLRFVHAAADDCLDPVFDVARQLLEVGLGADAAGAGQQASEEPLVAVVIPLLAGPDPALMRRMRQAVLSSGTGAEITDVLGPHPLLAEGVHVKLSEAGLARADRARLFTVATAADGIVLATVGGEDAVQAAGITGMLLAARLAVPVLAAGLDEVGAVARTAEQLRGSGSTQLAVAPCLIGPEVSEGLLDAAAEEAGCSVAEPLGAYPAVGKLVASTYAAKLGIGQQQSPQGLAAR
ncbi:MAG: hypothetical protein ACRDP3_05215 [Streptomyces sp.]|uniref:hypothetical protein n=1 Tax=Streptomyces sp. TaxID=1931 RepID=UPI003D6C66CB